MSYDNLEREERFPKKSCNKHIVISYVLHVVSIIFIIILMTKKETQLTTGRQLTGAELSPVPDWYTFDKTTKTLQFNAQTVIIGDRKLRKSLSGSNSITKLILHGYLQTTGIDIEKEVIVHGTNNVIRGPPGVAGAPGLDGINGQDGAAGIDGINGQDGAAGIDGVPGVAGIDGLAGAPGLDGIAGQDGAAGIDGINGLDGTSGVDGVPGVAGIDGLVGAPGLDGIVGQDGAAGVDGINGLDGTSGVDGVPGVAGTNGINGLAGTPGADGINGLDGTPGVAGTAGLDGASGESEWWEYNATEDILFIKSKMVTVDILDVVDTAYVHNMLYAGNLDTAVVGGHPGHPSVDGV